MIATVGYISLIIAFISVLLQAVPYFPQHKPKIAIAAASFTAISFFSLLYCYAVSDFSVLNVFNNSHNLKPFIYKLTATWGNHEGSMLLLVMIMALYNAFFAIYGLPDKKMQNTAICVNGLLISGFYAFIIFTSNPFIKIFPTPENGLGLNPLLQDVGLAMHPPVLYIGYTGFVIAMAASIAALFHGKAGKTWAASVKKWVLFSWSFLTLGIGLGSWWAYRELGWGGFWFWDPVENVSLMPWLAATALLHCLLVMEKRGSLKIWTLLLSIITFSLSLIGIFLVRSGILTSVHSFASDPSRGIFILIFLFIVIAGSFALFAFKAHKIKSENDFAPISKEGFLLFNNLLLSVACATVILGTLYPIFCDIFGSRPVSVGAPYFNMTFPYITLPLLILAAIAPALKWKQDSYKNILSISLIPFISGLIAFIAAFIIPSEKSAIAAVAIGFSAWLAVAMALLIYKSYKKSGNISASFYGMVTAHIGVAILTFGITCAATWVKEEEKITQIGEVVEFAGYNIKLRDMYITGKNNYLTRTGDFLISNKSGDEIAFLEPEVRYYPVEQTNTTESSIYYGILSNYYVAMGDSDDKGGFVARFYYKPMINLIWLGCIIMFAGGLVALWRKGK